jgi:hypothetical protein
VAVILSISLDVEGLDSLLVGHARRDSLGTHRLCKPVVVIVVFVVVVSLLSLLSQEFLLICLILVQVVSIRIAVNVSVVIVFCITGTSQSRADGTWG